MGSRQQVHGPEEAECDHIYHGHHSSLDGEGFCHGSHRGGGCSHEEVHVCHIRLHMDDELEI